MLQSINQSKKLYSASCSAERQRLPTKNTTPKINITIKPDKTQNLL